MNNIIIDGAKLRALLENETGLTLAEISTANGYSDRFLGVACKRGIASPNVVLLAKSYGITPDSYEIKPEPVEPEGEQMSFDEIPTVNEADIKIIRKAVRDELLNILADFKAQNITAQYEPRERVYKLYIKVD